MENIENMPRPEIVLVADTVAREKNIDKEDVFVAMEIAIQKAGRSRYGFEHDIRANIDRKTGAISLSRYREVVADDAIIENEAAQLRLSDAKGYDKNIEIGEFIIDPLPPIDFGRIAAQTAKQVIVQKVRDAERNRQYEEYKEKIGTIVNGTVKRLEFGNVVLDIGKTEAVLRRDEIIPREKFKNGDRVRAYVLDVRRENRGPQIFLSRTCPEFMAKLFTSEVPEIYDGIVQIMGVARDPGSKAKIAVKANDVTVDPVGACVGLRGIRVQAVVTELQGEKIDIVPYSEDKAQYLVAALAPAEVTKVVIDEENSRMEAVVPQEQFSIAIGRRGQNVKLASQLLGADIDVLTEDQEQERRANENKVRSERFMEALDVDDMIAHLLIAEGFSTIDEVAFVELSELAEIEGFDEDVATELQRRAKEFVEKRNQEFAQKSKDLGIDEGLKTIDGLDQDMIIKLAENEIKTLDDLADLAADELIEILGENSVTQVEANRIIMAAREHWFADEQ
ncbi:MAG: transcription termination/antitermination protein NusA [Alphaproteobacteria bacterium]|nr:transcription termination/antitermination protein NusA [Alphaproteobacteria bacterium]MBQ2811156.1 transcription termination/antitermination protein NusA [Alphaproteobacteria bacterium]